LLIALDWGTSSLRAWLLDATGAIAATRSAALGIMHISDARFEAAFLEVCGDWIEAHAGIRVIASGMVGSRQGWHEAPYVACPAAIEDLIGALLRFTTRDRTEIAIVPGVVLRTVVPDVMRGEETQVFGALSAEFDGVLVLPGTHSKWVRVRRGRIESFVTFMTGELFSVLREHSILGRLMEVGRFDEEAFLRGVDAGVAPGGIAAKLFAVRTLGLFAEVAASGLDSYLSGLLIGDELAEGRRRFAFEAGLPPALVGEPVLMDRYRRAFARLGVTVATADTASAVRGLWRIAVAAQLV